MIPLAQATSPATTPAATDAGSLDRLHDIIAPPPISWWPPAPGWIVLGCGVLLIALLLSIAGVRTYLRNRYRRDAIAKLREIESRFSSKEYESALADLSTLLKRVALTAFPRDRVAALWGREWAEFLIATDPGLQLSPPVRSLIEDAAFACGDQVNRDDAQNVCVAARHWIRHHTAMPASRKGRC